MGNCPDLPVRLRRVRACTGSHAAPGFHGYILCDDCETLWLEPDVHSKHFYPDSDAPSCPVCHQPLFGSQARWANEQDLWELGWHAHCTIEPIRRPATTMIFSSRKTWRSTWIPPEPPPVHHHDLHGNHEAPAEQLAEVLPQLDRSDEAAEPKPGC